ncbi:hypothetical protein MLD38_028063 [Melastoma candidum]|uniref:Uncharacterized protein n=1 Tax=Melastoma candidum TaxID=119954 RepID=A0ACB9N236_9MYRT|nr:hypothetical protein MLD38_028063 [Melastoma candidum]
MLMKSERCSELRTLLLVAGVDGAFADGEALAPCRLEEKSYHEVAFGPIRSVVPTVIANVSAVFILTFSCGRNGTNKFGVSTTCLRFAMKNRFEVAIPSRVASMLLTTTPGKSLETSLVSGRDFHVSRKLAHSILPSSSVNNASKEILSLKYQTGG